MNINHIFLFSALCGLSLTLLSAPTHARSPSETITIDVMGPTEIDYSEVDKYNQAVDKKTTQYVASNGDQLIFSDKPIEISQAYHPSHLTDLGVRINFSDTALSHPIIRTRPYVLINDTIQLPPIIPEMMLEKSAPITVMTPTILSLVDTTFWKIFAITTILLGALLLLTRTRKSTHPIEPSIYSGIPSANEMVGKGKLFDFNGNVLKGRVTPINTTFLNMLWHVGKFSKEGSMNTYFYMAFYIPPQQDYAKSLRKPVKIKETDTT